MSSTSMSPTNTSPIILNNTDILEEKIEIRVESTLPIQSISPSPSDEIVFHSSPCNNDVKIDETKEEKEEKERLVREKEEKEKEEREKEEKLEKEYRDVLVELFVGKWEKKFKESIDEDIHKDSIKFEIYNCNIKNIHGIEFYGYELNYSRILKTYYIEFNIYKHIDGIVDNNIGIDTFGVRCKGDTIREAFTSIITLLNTYIFCRHCGEIRTIDTYYKSQDKCECCIIADIISLDRPNSEYCSICMDRTKNYYTLKCGHKFHRSCVSKLEQKVCPLCRKNINTERFSLL